MSCIYPHPKDIYPRRELNTAKLSLPQGTIHFAVQRYTKKMTLANKSAIFLYFYSFTAYYAYLAQRFALGLIAHIWSIHSPLFYAVGEVRPGPV